MPFTAASRLYAQRCKIVITQAEVDQGPVDEQQRLQLSPICAAAAWTNAGPRVTAVVFSSSAFFY